MSGFRGRWLTAQDGLKLFYRDYDGGDGRRPPLLCLPGLTRNSADFADLAERLAGSRRIVCPDYRGRGRSAYDPNWRRYEPRVYLNDLLHLLAATDLGRVVVIGTSLGGVLGMALALARPAVLGSLILNDIGPDVAGGGLARILQLIARDRPQRDWAGAAAFLRSALPTLSFKTEEEWVRMARATFREGADGLLHYDWDVRLAKPLRRMAGHLEDLWPLFRSVRRVPLLVVRGGASDVLTAAGLSRMMAERPDLEAVTVPGVGHAPTLAEPPARTAIDEFLARSAA